MCSFNSRLLRKTTLLLFITLAFGMVFNGNATKTEWTYEEEEFFWDTLIIESIESFVESEEEYIKSVNEVIAYSTKAIENDPTFWLAYRERGRSYRKLGRDDTAILDFLMAAVFCPQYVQESNHPKDKALFDIYYNIAEIYALAGDLENAQHYLTIMITLEPETEPSVLKIKELIAVNDQASITPVPDSTILDLDTPAPTPQTATLKPTKQPTPEPTCVPEPTKSFHPELVWKKVEYTDGEVYEGYINLETGKSEGFGIYHWIDGDSYYGMFQNGKKTGFGIYLGNKDRDYYMIAGEWWEDMKNGTILVHWRNHDIWFGRYGDDEPISGSTNKQTSLDWHGFKENLRLGDGSLYTGAYNTLGGDFYSGFGIRKYSDGSMYIGKFTTGFSWDTSVRTSGTCGIFVSADHEVTEYTASSGESNYQRRISGPKEAPTPGRSPKPSPCLVCSSLKKGYTKCSNYKCKDGWYKVESRNPYTGDITIIEKDCPFCDGGWVECRACDGTGERNVP